MHLFPEHGRVIELGEMHGEEEVEEQQQQQKKKKEARDTEKEKG